MHALAGKVCGITGGANGIGRCFVERFVAAGFIIGQTMTVDGGMTRQMVYHGDEGWAFSVEAS